MGGKQVLTPLMIIVGPIRVEVQISLSPQLKASVGKCTPKFPLSLELHFNQTYRVKKLIREKPNNIPLSVVVGVLPAPQYNSNGQRQIFLVIFSARV